MTFEDPYAWSKFARVFAEKSGLTLEYHDHPVALAYTKENTIYVAKPSPNWDRQTYLEWVGDIFHEIGHHDAKFRGLFNLNKEDMDFIKGTDGSFPILNVAVDYALEHDKHGEYKGRDQTLADTQNEQLGRMLDRKNWNQVPALAQALIKLMFETKSKRWQQGLTNVSKITLSPKGEEYYNKIKDLEDDLDALDSSEGCMEFTRKACKLLNLETKPPPSQEQEQDKGEGDKGEGEGEGNGRGNPDNKMGNTPFIHPHEFKQQGEDDKEKGEEVYNGKEKRQALALNVSTQTDDTGYESLLPNYNVVVKVTNSGPPTDQDLVSSRSTLKLDVPHEANKVGTSLVKILLSRKQEYYEHKKVRGKLSTRHLPEVIQGNRNVFKKLTETITTNADVILLVDASGSMSGDKYYLALQSALVFSDSLSKLGVNHAIHCFTSSHSSHKYNSPHNCSLGTIIFKDFNEKVTMEQLKKRFSHEVDMSGNADGDSILYGYYHLRTQPAKKKVMVVFSDGSPSIGLGIWEWTSQVIKKLEKEITILGVGIQYGGGKKLYKNWVTINNISELPVKTIELVSKHIIT